MDDRILKLGDVMRILRISRGTTLSLLGTSVREGGLQGFKVRGTWRVKQSELDDFIKRNEQ